MMEGTENPKSGFFFWGARRRNIDMDVKWNVAAVKISLLPGWMLMLKKFHLPFSVGFLDLPSWCISCMPRLQYLKPNAA